MFPLLLNVNCYSGVSSQVAATTVSFVAEVLPRESGVSFSFMPAHNSLKAELFGIYDKTEL